MTIPFVFTNRRRENNAVSRGGRRFICACEEKCQVDGNGRRRRSGGGGVVDLEWAKSTFSFFSPLFFFKYLSALSWLRIIGWLEAKARRDVYPKKREMKTEYDRQRTILRSVGFALFEHLPLGWESVGSQKPTSPPASSEEKNFAIHLCLALQRTTVFHPSFWINDPRSL